MRLRACATALLAALALPASADELTNGRDAYLALCAACHGESGRGDGPTAASQLSAPTDLTLLERQNGGEFPAWRVFATIDGRFVVEAHGGRDMPIWGRQFLEEEAPRRGPKGGEAAAQERIHALVAYIESLQRR